MGKGKFSSPRPYRDEERQIEQAFRQVTGKDPGQRVHIPSPQDIPEEDLHSSQSSTADAYEESSVHSQPPSLDTGDLSRILSQGAHVPPAAPAFDLPTDIPDYPQLPLEEEEGFEEPEEDPQEDLSPAARFLGQVNQVLDYMDSHKKMVLAGLCGAALLLIVGVVSILLMGTSDPYDNKILNNVYLGSIHVGGMTKAQATTAVKNATDNTYTHQDMVIQIGTNQLLLPAKDTKASLDVKKAVNAAYDYGRTGTQAEREQAAAASATQMYVLPLLPYLELDQRYISKTLADYAQNAGSTLTQTNYGLEGQAPELTTDKFDANAPLQTLVIKMGTPGVGFDPADVEKKVLQAYSQNQFLVTVENVETITEPEPVDLEAIYKEFYIAPVDASLDPKTFEPVPGAYGYDFDLEGAKALLAAAQPGQEIRIPMRYVEPEILEDMVLYKDVLGEYKTKHTANTNRNTNLQLACQAINGVTLNPGQTFSFNDTLGERTAAKGYKPAPSYSGNETVDTIGGGICQVSSTLYNAALLSDLQIVSRTNHGFVSSYVPYGLDATVSWRSPDFQFKNTTQYPIQIQAEVSGGYVTVRILGIDHRDYYVKMEYKITASQEPEIQYLDLEPNNAEGLLDGDVVQKGTTGYTVKTYRVKCDNQTNREISRDFEATSQYKMVPSIVVRIIQPETEPTTQPTTEPTQPSTQPPTQPTTQPTAPSTTPPTTGATQPPASSEASTPPSEPSAPPSEPSQPPAPPEPAAGGDASANPQAQPSTDGAAPAA